MLSFEGRYKSKRQPPYVVDSKDLIHQKQEERRRRARQGYEEKAAIRIQSFTRGCLSRRRTYALLYQKYRELAGQILVNHATDVPYTTEICMCLRAFKIIGGSITDEGDIITISHILLAPSCLALFSECLQTNNQPLLHTFMRVISYILTYLRELPFSTPSKLYVHQIRVLELYLQSNNNSLLARTCMRRLSLDLCQRGRFYYSLAIFIDRQSLDFGSEFDDEMMNGFFRQPKNRAMLDLLHLPFKHCIPKDLCQGKLEPVTQLFLTSALTDVAAASLVAANGATNNGRFVESKIPRLILPALLKAIPSELLIGQLYSAAVHGSSEVQSIRPSLTLLHHFLCEVIPNLISISPAESLKNTLSHLDPDEDEIATLLLQQQVWSQPSTEATQDSSVVLALIRILGWMFSALLEARCPVSLTETTFSPPFPPPPLKHSIHSLNGYEEDDDDYDNEESVGFNESQSERCSERLAPFVNVWSTQTCEVFAGLQKCLPTLAHIALRELYVTPTSSLLETSQHADIVFCLSTLHSMLSFVRSSSAMSMIPLNSVLSQCPGFLCDLWYLTQNFQSDREPGAANQMWRPASKFFDLITSGDMAILPLKIDQYTAIVLTLTNCLRHRLLCLTDLEINGESSSESTAESVYGFSPPELLRIGTRLRDLMLGLVTLAYPPHQPELDHSLSGSALPLEVVLARHQERANSRDGITKATARRSSSSTMNAANRLSWILHRWGTMFKYSQALVTLIYDWDHRRQSRETAYLTKRGLTEMSSSESDGSVWLKPGALPAFRLEKLPHWLHTVEATGEPGEIALFGAPFGYYSYLNVDMDEDNSPIISYVDWRQMTILMEMPFVITFWRRVNIFQGLIYASRHYIQNTQAPSLDFVPDDAVDRMPPIRVRARRGYVYDDAFESCSKENAPSLLPRLNVTFFNKANLEEMGVDGGGLSREFLSQVLTEGFNPARGFFLCTEENTLYPNPNAEAVAPLDYLRHFYFLGRMLAKAIYEGMLVELHFAHFFLAKLVTRTRGFGVGFDYLRSLDQELYRQLCKLKTYEGNVRDLELDFTTVQAAFGESKVIELKPGGSSIPVTNATRVEYVNLIANYKLNRQIYRQSKAFVAGMTDVIDLDWFRLFDAQELQVLISGADADIDVEDLRTNSKYVADMTKPQNKCTIELFWQIVASFTQDQKQALLRFVTACSRPPMFGFKDLLPKFTIQLVPDTDRLPTASTCMNLLKLPIYQEAETLASKLLYALKANAGFEYS